MRLRNLFENNNLINQELEKLFEVNGKIEILNNVVNIEGSLKIAKKKKIKSLPFTLGVISENLDLMDAGLETLQGMPTEANTVSVDYNIKVSSLLGCEGLKCKEFSALGLSITNLEYCPSAIDYDFDECPLKSLQGLRTQRLESLKVDSKSLIDITPLLEKQDRDVSDADVRLTYHTNLPLIYLTLLKGRDGFFPITIENIPTDVESILIPYQGKGPTKAIDLGTQLVELGYKSNARLR